MGRPLGYRALQTRLAGIWRPTGTTHLIDLGYGYFIMCFDVLKDYQHALMDGPWFVGDNYLHVQAWEADFHPQTAKISTTAIWIRLEQLPIEYYHPEFLKHVGKKLGKLLKVDAITSAAIRGRFARVCVQINIANPLPKRVKIGSFWQDIVYENLPMLCYNCGRIGHRETHYTERLPCSTTVIPLENDTHTPTTSLHDPADVASPWKTVQTQRSRPHGRPSDNMQRSKIMVNENHPVFQPRGQASTDHSHRQRTQEIEAVKGLEENVEQQPPGFNRGKVALNGKKYQPMQPCEKEQAM
ncbi:uncharacterized protein LOC115956313 [Quercus lobata]|uniref:DUF4283 domain-containing protein n=1 Tax=Quercus lobata TaxID=97700 RepID=A0A7N2M8B2_QUELO|nr:uncharacterized protein LOC115956313 [Quercus lobata]